MFTYSLSGYDRRPSFIKTDLNVHRIAAYLYPVSSKDIFFFATLDNSMFCGFWASDVWELVSSLFVDLHFWGLRPLVYHLWELEWKHRFNPFVFRLDAVIELRKSLVSYLPRWVFQITAKFGPERWLERRLRPDYAALGFAYRILKDGLQWCGLWLLNKVRLFDDGFGACFVRRCLFSDCYTLVAFDLCLSRLFTCILCPIRVNNPQNTVQLDWLSPFRLFTIFLNNLKTVRKRLRRYFLFRRLSHFNVLIGPKRMHSFPLFHLHLLNHAYITLWLLLRSSVAASLTVTVIFADKQISPFFIRVKEC